MSSGSFKNVTGKLRVHKSYMFNNNEKTTLAIGKPANVDMP